MNTYINLPAEEKRLYCEQAQSQLGFLPATIEKDFWVCWTLRELFYLPEWGTQLTFKGGTSLSKAWKLIQRFSEDIDIVIDRGFLGFGHDNSPEIGANEEKIKARLRDLRKVCSKRIRSDLFPRLEERFQSALPADLSWSLDIAWEDEDPDQQTLLFQYPTVFPAVSAYLRPVVKIELGARSDHEPSSMATICPFLAETFPKQFPESSFQVTTLTAERTFLEKIMLVHEETFRPAGKVRQKGMARHYYDLWVLITKGVGSRAIQDPALFHQVAEHRKIYFQYRWMDYETLKPETIRLKPLASQIQSWREDYNDMQREMFAGEVPPFDEMMDLISDFGIRWGQSISR
jgi:predicted nucleotidyltransferase component of viral defense system